jgi:GNAT superfamily N-acetyltransferase
VSETTKTMGDRAAEGLIRSFAFFIERVPGAIDEAGASGVHLYNFTVPISSLTGVFALGPEPDPAEIAAFADKASAFDMPWSIVTRTAPSQEVVAIAARHGLTASSTTPLLARDLVGVESVLVDVPEDATVRKVDGAHAEVFAEALAAGFEMPKAIADVFALPSMLDDPAIDAFVLEVDGVAVTTGENVVDGEYVGLYNGAGRPEYRRNGYFRALVSARLRDSVGKGARFAFTQNTSMSRPLYESLGFRVVEEWTYLTKPGDD